MDRILKKPKSNDQEKRIESQDSIPFLDFLNETLSASIEESDCSFDITDVEFQSQINLTSGLMSIGINLMKPIPLTGKRQIP